MIALDPPLRLARSVDAPVLARLVAEASEGLALHVWQQSAGPGEDPWAVGERRQREKVALADIVVVDEGEGPVAALTGYPIPEEPERPGPDTPALVRPLIELEALAPATWYVNVLATLPGHRGRGWGALLLGTAERLAAEAGLTGLSLVVADLNLEARRLYERHGYRELARREMVKNGWDGRGAEWILMVKGAGTITGDDAD